MFVLSGLNLFRIDGVSCIAKSFLYSGSLTLVSMVGRKFLWCVAGWCFVK